MRVSKRRKAQRVQLYYDSEQLECVCSFKYLGIDYNNLNNTCRTLLKPILTYVSEIWGTTNYDVIENFYFKFLKQVLGVKASTYTCMIYAKTGRHPMSIAVQKSVIKY